MVESLCSPKATWLSVRGSLETLDLFGNVESIWLKDSYLRIKLRCLEISENVKNDLTQLWQEGRC